MWTYTVAEILKSYPSELCSDLRTGECLQRSRVHLELLLLSCASPVVYKVNFVNQLVSLVAVIIFLHQLYLISCLST